MFGVAAIDYCNTCETSAWIVILLGEPRIKNRLHPWAVCDDKKQTEEGHWRVSEHGENEENPCLSLQVGYGWQ